MEDSPRRSVHLAIAAVSLALSSPALSKAGTVVPMRLTELADHAGQVIVGRVAAIRAYWADDPRRIESEIQFSDVEFLKAAPAGATRSFRLIVPGGDVGPMRMRLCAAPELRIGEKWVLFLLPQYRTYPVVGLAQGAFHIVRDADGVERVYDASLHRITGIDRAGFVRHAGSSRAAVHDRLRAADRARLVPRRVAAGDAVATRFDEFKALIQPVLDASKDHHLTRSAGERIIVRHTATRLSPAMGTSPEREAAIPARPAEKPTVKREARRRVRTQR